MYSVEAQPAPLPNVDLLDNEHYIIVGHVYEPYSDDNVVTLINTRTNEWLQVVATDDEDGMKEYLFNLANLHSGWTHDDNFTINYGSEFIHFNIIKDSVAYQQDIQRPDDVDPIFILTGFLIIAVGGGYFYMKKKKSNQEAITMEEEPQETTPDTRSWIDKVFGGTKKAILFMLVATVSGSMIMDKPIAPEFIEMTIYLLMIYFGAGSVKLGMNMKK